MFRKRRMVWVSIVVALIVVSLGAGGVMAKSLLNPIDEDGVISGAYQKNNGMLRLVNGEEDVRESEVFIQWNQEGEKGDKGDPGPQGEPGVDGTIGPTGPAGPSGAPKYRIIYDAQIREWDPGDVFGCTIVAPSGWTVVSGGFNYGPTSRDSLKLITSIPSSLDEKNPWGAPKAWICMFEGLFWGSGAIEMYAVVTAEGQ